MKFAAFFMAEYANMITVASMTTILFLGGWQPLCPVALGSNFVAPALFAFAGAICLYHGLHPARPSRSLHASGVCPGVLRIWPRRC